MPAIQQVKLDVLYPKTQPRLVLFRSRRRIKLVLAPRNVLGLAPAVNAVLGGNVGNSFPIRWRMWVFYFLVWLQRHHPIAPRLTLVPKADDAVAPAQTSSVVS